MACPHWRGKSRAGCGRSWPPHRGARGGGGQRQGEAGPCCPLWAVEPFASHPSFTASPEAAGTLRCEAVVVPVPPARPRPPRRGQRRGEAASRPLLWRPPSSEARPPRMGRHGHRGLMWPRSVHGCAWPTPSCCRSDRVFAERVRLSTNIQEPSRKSEPAEGLRRRADRPRLRRGAHPAPPRPLPTRAKAGGAILAQPGCGKDAQAGLRGSGGGGALTPAARPLWARALVPLCFLR